MLYEKKVTIYYIIYISALNTTVVLSWYYPAHLCTTNWLLVCRDRGIRV